MCSGEGAMRLWAAGQGEQRPQAAAAGGGAAADSPLLRTAAWLGHSRAPGLIG